MTPVTQGVVALGQAIAYFTSLGYIVSIPLNDNQDYDLIVDIDDVLYRVQVKSTRHKRKGQNNYTVQLKSVRPNKTENKIKKFDASCNELLFISTETNERYLIPSSVVDGTSTLNLGDRVKQFKLS